MLGTVYYAWNKRATDLGEGLHISRYTHVTWWWRRIEETPTPPHNIRVQNGNGKSDVSIDPVNRELPKFQQLKRAYLYIMTQNASLGQQFIVLMEV